MNLDLPVAQTLAGIIGLAAGFASPGYGGVYEVVMGTSLFGGLWLLAAWIVIQWMNGLLSEGQGVMLATPAHIGGFVAGLALQRPLLLWRYRRA